MACMIPPSYFSLATMEDLSQGTKRSIYDTGIQCPLVIKWHNHETEKRNDQLISFIDFAPTVLDILDIKSDHQMEGVSFYQKRPTTTNIRGHRSLRWIYRSKENAFALKITNSFTILIFNRPSESLYLTVIR